MKRGLSTSLPEEVEQFLSAERAIPPAPEALQRRAELRARTALWHVRVDSPSGTKLGPWFKRLTIATAAILFASASFGAWLVLGRPFKSEAVPNPTVGSTPPPAISEPMRRTPPVRKFAPPVPRVTAEAKPEDSATVNSRRSKSTPSSKREDRAMRRAEPLPDELAMLNQARRAVAQGNFERALHKLAVHAQRFPHSQLAEERDALRVLALAGAGRDNEAQKAKARFESQHPDSMFVPTLKRSGRSAP